jgi:hypothetical protein
MPQEEQYDPSLSERPDHRDDPGVVRDHGDARELDEELLPTISLVHVPHEKIPRLYQCCYEYVEPWQWSSQAELVETGRWFFGPAKEDL